MLIIKFFKLVGKALRFSISRPMQRFNIESRAKKYTGEDSKYFTPAPRAIGSLTQSDGPVRYPHLDGGSRFISITKRRLKALEERNQRLAQEQTDEPKKLKSNAFSETERDDELVIKTSNYLSVSETVVRYNQPPEHHTQQQQFLPSQQKAGDGPPDSLQTQSETRRPLPKLHSLNRVDRSSIWYKENVRPGRLDLNMLQEMLINKLADADYWTAKKISEKYNIKEEYADNIIRYLKQVRIILSPREANFLDYVARNNPVYQATKHIVYSVDKSLRSEIDKQYDATFLPTDELEPKIRDLIEPGALQAESGQIDLKRLFAQPRPLRVKPINVHKEIDSPKRIGEVKKLEAPSDKENDVNSDQKPGAPT